MTLEKQRIKILEFLGWRDLHRKGFALRGTNPNGKENQIAPNPLTNLNVMYEAEKLLPRPLYHVEYWSKGYGRFLTLLSEMDWHHSISAPAEYRAKALLKTIGQWEK